MSDANRRRRRSSHAVRKDAPGEPAGVYTKVSLKKNGDALQDRWVGVQRDDWMFGTLGFCVAQQKAPRITWNNLTEQELAEGADRPPPPVSVGVLGHAGLV